MSNPMHDIDESRIKPDSFVAYIEISKGSKNKYELDKESGLLRLDRILYTSTHYPQNYGFIPKTFASDGDPLDVLVLCSESINPSSLVDCYPIGVLEMVDNGSEDQKIIAICGHDPFFNCYKDMDELPSHLLDEIKHFFAVYKELEGKSTLVTKIDSKKRAIEVISQCIEAYKKRFPKVSQ